MSNHPDPHAYRNRRVSTHIIKPIVPLKLYTVVVQQTRPSGEPYTSYAHMQLGTLDVSEKIEHALAFPLEGALVAAGRILERLDANAVEIKAERPFTWPITWIEGETP